MRPLTHVVTTLCVYSGLRHGSARGSRYPWRGQLPGWARLAGRGSLRSDMTPARFHQPPPRAVLRAVLTAVAGGLLAVATGSCGVFSATDSPVQSPHADPHLQGQPATPAPVAAPPIPLPPQPVAKGPCPYLPSATVETINGEQVGAVQVSGDRPYPACFFLRGDGAIQLRTWIVVATPEVARATVDAAAPVATSDLAELSNGWSGGSQPTADGAVFAVARQGTAVVVTTNQRQTISARQVAGQVIAALGL
jgi:UPF0176 protein